jgi:hypothetical protein
MESPVDVPLTANRKVDFEPVSVRFLQWASAKSSVIIWPETIDTSSLAVGITPPIQVVGEPQLPEAEDDICGYIVDKEERSRNRLKVSVLIIFIIRIRNNRFKMFITEHDS